MSSQILKSTIFIFVEARFNVHYLFPEHIIFFLEEETVYALVFCYFYYCFFLSKTISLSLSASDLVGNVSVLVYSYKVVLSTFTKDKTRITCGYSGEST